MAQLRLLRSLALVRHVAGISGSVDCVSPMLPSVGVGAIDAVVVPSIGAELDAEPSSGVSCGFDAIGG